MAGHVLNVMGMPVVAIIAVQPRHGGDMVLHVRVEPIHSFVRDRGLDWEIHIDDTPRNQWTVQGMRPPDSGSDEEKRWIRENRPSKPPQNVAATT
jgi:Putative oxalocrotonate tautomerase enzyme